MSAVSRTPESLARVGALDLCWDSFGSPDDPALLLIMGLGTQMIAWDEQFCESLAAKGFYVIRFDNRDIGRSTWLRDAGVPRVGLAVLSALIGRTPSAPYVLEDMADDAVGLLDVLGIERAHIVGASMGGAIAQTIAIRHPQRVISLVPIMASSGARGLPGPTPEATALLLRRAPKDEQGYLQHHRKALALLRVGDFPEEVALDEARARRGFARGVNPAGTARQLAAILASGSRKSALVGVRAPTLVIHGDVDPLVPMACGADIAATVPGARLQIVRGMGHALPRRFWPEVIQGIADHAHANP